MSLDDISKRLSASSIDLPSGSINSGGVSRQIRSERLAKNPNDLRKIEVLSKATGEKLYLGDIAISYEFVKKKSKCAKKTFFFIVFGVFSPFLHIF